MLRKKRKKPTFPSAKVTKIVTPDDIIVGTYKHDYNIVEVRQKIRNSLDYKEQKRINEIEENLDTLRNNNDDNPIEIKWKKREMKNLNTELDHIKSGNVSEQYMNDTESPINAYLELKRYQMDFFSSDQPRTERIDLIEKFTSISQMYFNLILNRESDDGERCPTCNEIMEDDEDDEDFFICPSCENGIMKEVTIMVYRDYDKDGGEEKKNFIKVLNSFQGKGTIKWSEDLYITLDNRFEEDRNIPTRYQIPFEEYSTNRVEDMIVKPGTDITSMHDALSETGNSEYFQDIYVICREYWGWKLPNLTEYESIIMEKYNEWMSVFPSEKGDRKSSLNAHWLLYKILSSIGLEYPEEYFKLIKTESIQKTYNDIYTRCMGKLGWDVQE